MQSFSITDWLLLGGMGITLSLTIICAVKAKRSVCIKSERIFLESRVELYISLYIVLCLIFAFNQ